MRLAAAFVAAMLTQSSSALPFRVIESGAQSGIQDARRVVINAPGPFAELWREHSPRPAPAVDFAQESIVGIFLGARPTAGYQVEIVSVRSDGPGTLVEFRERAPGADAITAQVITFPFVLASVRNLTPPVRFESRR